MKFSLAKPLASWRFYRRLAQTLFLLLFVAGFVSLAWPTEQVPSWLDWFFRIDPFLAMVAMLAAKTFLWVFWPSFLLLILTAIFGRFFCGWICPLGTLIDILGRFVRLGQRFDATTNPGRRWPRKLRYFLLIVALASALIGWPVVAHLDPFPILGQSLTQAIDPAAGGLTSHGSLWLEDHAPTTIGRVSGQAYRWMLEHRLMLSSTLMAGSGMALAILISIFLLERLGRRFWCRYLCPLGSLLGLAARWSWLSRRPTASCPHCGLCATDCRMGAFDGADRRLAREDCTLCMDCLESCPKSIAKFRLTLLAPSAAPPLDVSRRTILTATAVGVTIPLLHRSAKAVGVIHPTASLPLIRPPGAIDAGGIGFIQQCLRCGLCLKACPTQVLQPAILESGIDGLFTPWLDFEKGYCEYQCHQCTQVCPSHAIAPLDLPAKQATRIGKAIVDKNRCLPWISNEPCLCCEEHCPIAEKAIKVEHVIITRSDGTQEELGRPVVDHRLCIGCGICQNKCPIEGAVKGIRVIPPNQRRPAKPSPAGDDQG